MTNSSLGKRLHQQSEKLPRELLEEASEFAIFTINQRQQPGSSIDWQEEEWQEFALTQFMLEADDIEYFLSDAQEVFYS